MSRPRILLTTDLSSDSEVAFAPAVELAAKIGAELTMLHVVEDLQAIPHGAPLAPPQSDPSVGQREKEAQAKLEALAKKLPGGVAVTPKVIVAAKVPEAIASVTAELRASLVVIASHGRGGARGLILGSTADGVLRRAGVPVLVVPVASAPHSLHLQ